MTLFVSLALMLFLVVGAVSAADVGNVSNTEDSNLASDNVNSLSVENKLEVSSEDSISETNIVNSHDDNLNYYPTDSVLSSSEGIHIWGTGKNKTQDYFSCDKVS